MEINFAETKAIAETLPIGLYAKRRIPVSMSDSEETSYYNPVTDEIVISYPIIKTGLAKAELSDLSKETAVRSMEYHELSHAILTPACLTMNDAINTFEDERIETLLNNYYLDVNFKKQVLLINGYKSKSEIGAPSSGFEAFYQIVRFGVGKAEFVAEVDEIIKRYAHLTRVHDEGTWDYRNDIMDLYRRICKDFDGSDGGKDSSSEGSGSGSGSTIMDKVGGKAGQQSTDSASASASADDASDEDGMNGSDGEPCEGRTSPLSASEISEMFEDFFGEHPYHDTALTQKMSMIIDNFSKRNNSGSSMCAYSGVFNPRSIANRDDYKYWDKRSTVNGMNKFGSLHLNLFIDESGSFYGSTEPMNKLLYALTEIEKKNKNFTLDVVFCGMSERVVKTKQERVFCAHGGNKLDKKVYDIFRALQKPNTFNYNIICFDGDACSDGGRGDHGFGAFDHSNCTIISDYSNERYIHSDVHSAKVIYTRDYADELIDNVMAVLGKAFR